MRNPKYDIVFEGRFVEGADPGRVKVLVGQIFKIGPNDAERFFSGRRVVIRKGVDLSEAQRFKKLMRKAGAACRLVPQDAPLSGHPDLTTVDRPLASKRAPQVVAARGAESDRPAGIGARPEKKNSEDIHRLVPGGRTQREYDLGETNAYKRLRSVGRSRGVQVLLGTLTVVVMVSIAALWHENGPMPADAATLKTFVTGFNNRLLKVKTGRARAVTYVKVARAVIEDMGYDYDKTLLNWRFNPTMSQEIRQRAFRDDYLMGPLKILFELDAEQMNAFMAPETYAALENTLKIGDHITLESIHMLRECARGQTLVPHEALVSGLAKFDIKVDANFPALSVEEAFYGLHYNGLIQIHTRLEWKTKRVELEILDRAQIAAQEKKLQQLENLYAQYAQRP